MSSNQLLEDTQFSSTRTNQFQFVAMVSEGMGLVSVVLAVEFAVYSRWNTWILSHLCLFSSLATIQSLLPSVGTLSFPGVHCGSSPKFPLSSLMVSPFDFCIEAVLLPLLALLYCGSMVSRDLSTQLSHSDSNSWAVCIEDLCLVAPWWLSNALLM